MEYRYYNSTAVTDKYREMGRKYPHASAFGACWAVMTQEQKDYIFRFLKIEIPELEEI